MPPACRALPLHVQLCPLHVQLCHGVSMEMETSAVTQPAPDIDPEVAHSTAYTPLPTFQLQTLPLGRPYKGRKTPQLNHREPGMSCHCRVLWTLHTSRRDSQLSQTVVYKVRPLNNGRHGASFGNLCHYRTKDDTNRYVNERKTKQCRNR